MECSPGCTCMYCEDRRAARPFSLVEARIAVDRRKRVPDRRTVEERRRVHGRASARVCAEYFGAGTVALRRP